MIKKIGILSVALYSAVMAFFCGLIWGLVVVALHLLRMQTQVSGPMFAAFGMWILLISPVLSCLVGFIFGAIAAFLANLALKIMRGVKVELSSE